MRIALCAESLGQHRLVVGFRTEYRNAHEIDYEQMQLTTKGSIHP